MTIYMTVFCFRMNVLL